MVTWHYVGPIQGPTVQTPPRKSATQPFHTFAQHRLPSRSNDTTDGTTSMAMASSESRQSHLSQDDLSPLVTGLLQEISQALDNEWDRATEALEFVTRYGTIREPMLKLIEHREVFFYPS